MIVFKLLILSLWAQPTLSTSLEKQDVANKKYEIFGEFVVETSQSRLGGQRQQPQTGIQNFSLATQFKLDNNIDFYAELLGEQNNDDTNVYVGEIFIDHKFSFYDDLKIKIGNMYYPFGLLVGEEGMLSQRPSYYNDLLVTKRGIDLGGSVRWQPLAQPIYLDLSVYSGITLRSGDQQIEPADINPQAASLIYAPSFMTIQATYLQRKYQRNPLLTAFGLMAESTPISLQNWLKIKPMAEYWSLNYRRSDGQERVGNSYLIGHETHIFWFYHRWVFANEQWTTSGLSNEVNVDFQLNGIGVHLGKHLRFEYQHILNKEVQPSLELLSANEDVYRLLFVF